ncbi:MAG: hypothetical protein F6K35_44095 [Okeania sp. SIO2H7]|nr:hypothetical protein [Okeania sp. SIO2H7]
MAIAFPSRAIAPFFLRRAIGLDVATGKMLVLQITQERSRSKPNAENTKNLQELLSKAPGGLV